MRFSPGVIIATPAAVRACVKNKTDFESYLSRHVNGDWGDIDEEDKRENEFAVGERLRIFSAYDLRDGTRLWVITEADRSSTCILLPSEY
jgi:hypothetical protein